MSPSDLPPRVQRFLATHIDSLEKLEVLLHARAQASRAWTAAEVARELRIAEESAGGRLADLAGRGLLAPEAAGTVLAYRYRPGAHDADVAELATTYAQRRVSVITFIFASPVERLRDFADAFRLTPKKEPGDG